MSKRLTTEQFIERAKEIHGDKYSYELVEYVNAYTKVKITCPDHGVFEQTPTAHIHSRKGCALCANNIRLTTEQFITKAKEVHGDKYSYELTKYVNARIKVKIVCPEHGVFEQAPILHLRGQGCYRCAGMITIKPNDGGGRRLTTEQFITKAKKVHGDKYTYELVDYVNNYTKVKITCPIHGVFEQVSSDHTRGRGCLLCGLENMKSTTEQFIERAKEIHGDKYSYRLVEYVTNKTKVKIICPEHGVWEQVSGSHLYDHGCPVCANNISQQEIEFTDYIKSFYDGTVIANTRSVIPPYELDVYLPDLNIAFEYNGTYWHNEGVTKPIGYHDMKTDMCKAIDITLHHIWEDEWMNNREETEQQIRVIL